MWDGHLTRINVAKDRIDVTNKDVSPVCSAPNRDRTADQNIAAVKNWPDIC